MKNIISILIMFLINNSFSFAQEKLSGPFELNIKVPPTSQANKLYLNYNSLDGKTIQDSATVVNGHASFKGTLTLPRIARLELSKKRTTKEENPEILKFNPYNIVGQLTFFLEPGQINISTDKDSLAAVKIIGGAINDGYLQFNQLMEKATKPVQDLSQEYAAIDSSDHISLDKIDSAIRRLYRDIPEKTIKPFILDHINKYIGFYVLGEYANNDVDPTVLESLLNKFSDEYQQTPFGKYLKSKIKIARATAIGTMAIDTEQPDSAGNIIKLSSLKGKYVLLDFWASWCIPCRMENPNLLKAYQRFKKDDFTILSISIDTKRNNWLAAVHKDQLPWLQLSDLKVYNEAAMAYDVISIPQNYLIDPKGIIIAKNLRGEALEKELEKIFKSAESLEKPF